MDGPTYSSPTIPSPIRCSSIRRDGTFEEKGLELGVAYNDSGRTGSSMGSDAKDYDNDGNVDIFYNNLTGQVWQLLRNQGNLFQFPSASKVQTLSLPFSGWSAGFIDYNNDGWKDIYSANGGVDQVNEKSPQHDTMFENVGGKIVRGCVRGDGQRFPAERLSARLGLRRSEQRWGDGYRGDVA